MPDSTGKGLINFNALQNGLEFFVENQTQIFNSPFSQFLNTGPTALENMYFGPLAAAYFQYNDLVAAYLVNKDTWGPEYDTWPPCIANLSETTGGFLLLDMLQNANYNAGLYSTIFQRYVQICADPTTYATALSHIDDYALNDTDYNQIVGVNSASTFIIYPRQIRFYLDQLYGNNDRINTWLTVNNNLTFTFSSLGTFFESSMHTLGHGTSPDNYALITQSEASTAFNNAMTSNAVTSTTNINMSSSSDRTKMYDVLNQSFINLETTLNFKFTDATNSDLWHSYAISNLVATPTSDGANISWHVDIFNSAPLPSDGGIVLGTRKSSPFPATDTGSGNFTASFTGLEPQKSYQFIAFNAIGSANVAEFLSGFKTGSGPPAKEVITIKNVSINDLSDTSVKIDWHVVYSAIIANNLTDIIDFAKVSDPLQSGPTPSCSPVGDYEQACSVTLQSLSSSTQYQFALTSNDNSIPPVSTPYNGNFTTTGGPPPPHHPVVITMDNGYPKTTTTTASFAWHVTQQDHGGLSSRITFDGTSRLPQVTTTPEGLTCIYTAEGLEPATVYQHVITATGGDQQASINGHVETAHEDGPHVVVGPLQHSWTSQIGPSSSQGWGMLTISEAHGGTPPYTYSVTSAREDGRPLSVQVTEICPLVYQITNMISGVPYIQTVQVHDSHGKSSELVGHIIDNDWRK